jgi:prepilin-type N-terminal cleavage/methylation domain-containing protein
VNGKVGERGVTLIEIIFVVVLMSILIGAAAVAVAQDTTTSRIILAPMGPELRVNTVMERLASELRMAGEFGEDLDHDGELDLGEDTNSNGVLDADWNLADGAVDQTTLSFNRRIDERDADGNLLVSGIYSRCITYRLEGENLIREWRRSREDGTVDTLQTVLARGIGGLRFRRTGKLVVFSIDVLLPSKSYKEDRRTSTTQIWLRN